MEDTKRPTVFVFARTDYSVNVNVPKESESVIGTNDLLGRSCLPPVRGDSGDTSVGIKDLSTSTTSTLCHIVSPIFHLRLKTDGLSFGVGKVSNPYTGTRLINLGNPE